MNRARGVAVLACAGLVASLTACSGTGGAGAAMAKIELPAQNQAHWVMPLDEFQPPSQGSLASYAENLLTAQCLGESGIEWPIPWQPTDDADYLPPPSNPSGFPALTVEIAQASGYRGNFQPGVWGSAVDRQATFKELNGIAASTPGFETVFDTCTKDARTTIPSLHLNGESNRVLGWANEARSTVSTASPVITADAAWRDCLKGMGYVSVPETPLGEDGGMPTQALRHEVGIPDDPPPAIDDGPRLPLTKAEIALAVDDAGCRESSGWSKAVYEAMWNDQVKVVSQHADELVRMRDEWVATRATLLKVIAEHAPSR
jgi:hypothetical protein